jgi:DNA replication licensing factor MCM5
MDRESVYTLSIGFGSTGRDDEEDTRSKVQQQLINFILEFRVDNQFIYRDQIRENVLAKKYACDVDVAHLISYSEELAHRLTSEPADIIPVVCCFPNHSVPCTN